MKTLLFISYISFIYYVKHIAKEEIQFILICQDIGQSENRIKRKKVQLLEIRFKISNGIFRRVRS